jgi:hypothetical protein
MRRLPFLTLEPPATMRVEVQLTALAVMPMSVAPRALRQDLNDTKAAVERRPSHAGV